MSKIIGVTVGTPIGVEKLKEKIRPVTSVNGVSATGDGSVQVDVGVKTVNGQTPDASGNVNVSGGSGGGGTTVQADFAENDPAAAGYVKNRTHWHELELGEVLFDKTLALTFQESMTVSGSVNDGLVAGNTYLVFWDDVEHKCVCGTTTAGKPYIGDRSIIDTDAAAADYPFCIEGLGGTSYKVYRKSVLTTAKKGKVQAVTKDEWHKLDKNYLPDDLGGGVTDYNKLENKPVYAGTAEILPETTVEVDPDSGEGVLPDVLDVKVGDTVTVKWNGAEYTCTAEEYPDPEMPFPCIGNLALLAGSGDTGEPFFMMFFDAEMAAAMGDGVTFVALDGSETATLSISDEVIKKLDMKFLPEGYPHKTVEWVEVLPETTVEIDPDAGEGDIMDLFALTVGNQYKVIWNGAEYTCTAKEVTIEEGLSLVGVGDIGLMMGGTSTGEPFAVVAFPNDMQAEVGVCGSVLALDGSASATVSISCEAKIIHKMAGEYLPDGVPYAEPFDDVVMAAWPANVISSGGYEYFTDPVGKVVEGCWYKVTLGGVVYETIARRNTDNSGFVLGRGQGNNQNLLYGDFPFTIDIYDKPLVADDIMLFGDIYLGSKVSEVSTDDFSVRGSLEVQEIHERCLPITATPLVVRYKNGVADVTWDAALDAAKNGRLVMLITDNGTSNYTYYYSSYGAGYLTFGSVSCNSAGDIYFRAVAWRTLNNEDTFTFSEKRLATT